jgi:predicted alpha/beta hydrolase
MLGWTRTTGLDGVERDYYVRQLWDWKFSADIDSMTSSMMQVYAQLCGWTLARGHARSGDRIALAAYLGTGESFDKAISEFAVAYADQNERDYATVSKTLQDAATASTARS